MFLSLADASMILACGAHIKIFVASHCAGAFSYVFAACGVCHKIGFVEIIVCNQFRAMVTFLTSCSHSFHADGPAPDSFAVFLCLFCRVLGKYKTVREIPSRSASVRAPGNS